MFSGLTNQVSSLWSAAKGEQHDENVPTPPNSAAPEPAVVESSTTVEQPIALDDQAANMDDSSKKQRWEICGLQLELFLLLLNIIDFGIWMAHFHRWLHFLVSYFLELFVVNFSQ
jgi:hypothetical protein